jgi:hypothetical protein
VSVASRGPCGAPRLNVALVARLVDLKAALLAETRARGPDRSCMRSPQLAWCSRDQLRRRMGQHGAALGRGRGGGCEVFRARPPSLGRQLEARQRAERRAASESTVVDALLATDYTYVPLTRRLRRAVWLCGLKSPGSRLGAHPSTATSPSSTRSPRRLARRRLARRRHARRRHARRRLRTSAACA